MMKTGKYHTRASAAAIAAVLALSSTIAVAQEVTPDAATTAPEAAVPTEPVTTAPETTSAEPAAAPAPAARPKRTVTAKPKAAPAPVRTSARVAAKADPVQPAPAQPAPATASAKPDPIVDLTPPAETAAATPAPAKPAATSGIDREQALMYGGGALALLALGGAALALARRRRRDELLVDEVYEPEAEPIPAPEPAALAPMPAATPRHDPVLAEPSGMVAPAMSAFAWDKPPVAAEGDDDGSDRRPGESWVERAYRGPSPANPSVSLRNRLGRAAFFDKREREVAAGQAEPVDPDAGLPEAMVEEQERELA